MSRTVNREPQCRVPTGLSVYDRDYSGRFRRLIVTNHPETTCSKYEIPGKEKTVAQYNPEYDADAPVVETVDRTQLDDKVDNWTWLELGEIEGAAEEAGLQTYAYPAQRLKSTTASVPNSIETYREVLCYESARMMCLAATIEHPDKFQEPTMWSNYKKRVNGEVSLSAVLKENQYQLQKDRGVCTYCNREAKTTFDHIIPRSKGGPDTISNMVPACQSCNSSKLNTNLLEWHQAHDMPIDRVVLGKYLKHKWNEFESNDILDSKMPDDIRSRWEHLEITRRISSSISLSH